MSHFHLFLHGSAPFAPALLEGCTRVGEASVAGILYELGENHRALVLYGDSPVAGAVWRCPSERLRAWDAADPVANGRVRRVARDATLQDGSTIPCWLYAAGPAVSRQLTPQTRIL